MLSLECRGRFPAGFSELKSAKIAALAYKMAGGKARTSASLSVIGDAEMKVLNRLHRGKNQVTDVLSFGYGQAKGDFKVAEGSGPVPLGDIIIDLPQVRRQAKVIERPVSQEFALMVVHGILHLLGYDHETESQERKMFRLQQDILIEADIL